MTAPTPRSVPQQLRMWRQAGVERVVLRKGASPPCGTPDRPALAPASAQDDATGGDDARRAALALVEEEVRGCTRCAELAASRTQTVFGAGPVRPRLCFLGEAPGADEDRQGVPFVGRSGQLLTRIIEACTLRREEVYICNVLKCRPPGNRTPTSDEVDHCRGYFERQLKILRPEFICCLGGVAASALLQTKSPLSRLRGHFHPWGDCQVLVTYHPSYLLRNPAAKKDTWDDMQLLMQAMGIHSSR